MANRGLRPVVVKVLQTFRLNRLAHKVYYRYVHGFRSGQDEVLEALERCFRRLKEEPLAEEGDYFEFGVFKGHSFWWAQKTARSQQFERMRFFGCDSFEGLPEIGDVDTTTNDEFYAGQYSCSKAQVIENLKTKSEDIDWERTELIEGYFDRTLTPGLVERHGLKQVSVALIDCDLYSSTVDVLAFIRDLLVDGSILMFDDWNSFDRDDDRGQRRAFREFLEANPSIRATELFSYGHYGQVFAVSVSARRPPNRSPLVTAST